jgi:hypothetical protein
MAMRAHVPLYHRRWAMRAPGFAKREIRWHSGRCPRCWRRSWLEWPESYRFVPRLPMPSYTVRGHARPIRRGGCCGGGPHGSQLRPRAFRVPRARRKYADGVGRSHPYVTGVGRGRDCSRPARRARGLAAGSGEAKIVRRASGSQHRCAVYFL